MPVDSTFARSCRQEQHVFNANGFDFKELEDGQVQLTAVPFSKEAVLGPQDVHELLHLLIHGQGNAFKMQTQQPVTPSQPFIASQASSGPSKIVRPSRRAHSITPALAALQPWRKHATVRLLSQGYSYMQAVSSHEAMLTTGVLAMQGEGHAGYAGLPLIDHDREGAEQGADADGPGAPVPFGLALELSSWPTHNEASSHLAAGMTAPSCQLVLSGLYLCMLYLLNGVL